ncbi:MAG: mevalonate kinase [Ichthyobacteriaceae bacterium]|nr:mevalonate kinase [Ichthyobacteriaceae bacterium]
MKGPLFYAKVLLFGEYGIIKDSMGLSIPYNFYKGTLKLPVKGVRTKSTEKDSNISLNKYAQYIKTLTLDKSFGVEFNIDALQADVDSGAHFDSSIPQGYGVGSSGALVAAIYDRYANNKLSADSYINKEKINKLKSIFGVMESYFHGTSSGIDPLICYLNIPILIKSKNDVDVVGIPKEVSGKGAVFLIDSGTPGETEPMVNVFMEKCKNEGFRNMLKHQFVKYNDSCIQSFVKGEFNTLFKDLKSLSTLVLDNFKPMIPTNFHALWKNGIETDDYYMKLCGSGGGGYILGFAEDFEKAKESLKGQKLEVIYRF